LSLRPLNAAAYDQDANAAPGPVSIAVINRLHRRFASFDTPPAFASARLGMRVLVDGIKAIASS
jgi:hypothetical protein